MGRRKSKTSFGMLFWLAFVLLILVIFSFNRKSIEQVLQKTGFVAVVQDKFGTSSERGDEIDEIDEIDEARVEDTAAAQSSSDTGVGAALQKTARDIRVLVSGSVEAESNSRDESEADTEAREADEGYLFDDIEINEVETPDSESRASSDEEAAENVAAAQPLPEEQSPSEMRDILLYYIRIGANGEAVPEQVSRAIPATTAPMSETVRHLLSGPNDQEANNGLRTLIPSHTKLLSAWVTDKIAYLNFNEAFLFNSLGIEGAIAQLKQIIYSVTEFPTVESVQILIEGEAVEYLGSEGVYIGAALTR